MSETTDLMRQAHDLAERIRRQRSADAASHRGATEKLTTMLAQQAQLWESIRAQRAGIASAPNGRMRQTRWE